MTYVVGKRVVEAEFPGQPVCKGLEAAAQHGHFVSELLERAAQFARARGDGDDGLELLKDVCGDALEQADARFEGFGKVEFAVHGAGGDFLYQLVEYTSRCVMGVCIPKPPSRPR